MNPLPRITPCCPGCGSTVCPYPRLECGGESDAVRAERKTPPPDALPPLNLEREAEDLYNHIISGGYLADLESQLQRIAHIAWADGARQFTTDTDTNRALIRHHNPYPRTP